MHGAQSCLGREALTVCRGATGDLEGSSNLGGKIDFSSLSVSEGEERVLHAVG